VKRRMPTLPPGTEVSIRPDALRRLNFPPPEVAALIVGVHDAALKAPESPHTQLLGFQSGELVWAGALSEVLLDLVSEEGGDPRQLLGEAIGTGARLWDIVWPGELMSGGERRLLSTMYQGERPWVVIGETTSGDLLAAPLNEAGNPKWYTPLLAREEVIMHGSSKDAQLELAHLWSLPASLARVGTVSEVGQARVMEALKVYF
jgi:hypothetical protein